MTSFREYQSEMRAGTTPDRKLPTLPSYAVRFQGDRAGFISRAVAAGIDVALIFLVVLGTIGVIWMISFILEPIQTTTDSSMEQSRVPAAAAMILYGYALNVLYWTAFWAMSGRTIGNLVMGLRVVNRKGEHLGWAGAFIRALFCTIFPIGLAWAIISGANRSVQDVVLRTSVIYDWVVGIPGLTRTVARPDTVGEDTPVVEQHEEDS
jgi:uncharacterized RDD family membrane protein YckC